MTLCGIILLVLSSVHFLITLEYTVHTLSHVHFRIDLILCTCSYNSLWVMWDYLRYVFLLTVYYVHFPITLCWIILYTFSYYSRVYNRIIVPKCLTRHFCNYLVYIFILTLSYVHFLITRVGLSYVHFLGSLALCHYLMAFFLFFSRIQYLHYDMHIFS